jgi:hypothetical protein
MMCSSFSCLVLWLLHIAALHNSAQPLFVAIAINVSFAGLLTGWNDLASYQLGGIKNNSGVHIWYIYHHTQGCYVG